MDGIEKIVCPGYAVNQYGIRIKMCCASCKMRKINNSEGRFCGRSGEEVFGFQYCRKWALNPKFRDAGLGGGKIKSLRYLNYYRERWIMQRNDLLARRITADEVMSEVDIRKEYEKEHGSIFLNF